MSSIFQQFLMHKGQRILIGNTCLLIIEPSNHMSQQIKKKLLRTRSPSKLQNSTLAEVCSVVKGVHTPQSTCCPFDVVLLKFCSFGGDLVSTSLVSTIQEDSPSEGGVIGFVKSGYKCWTHRHCQQLLWTSDKINTCI